MKRCTCRDAALRLFVALVCVVSASAQQQVGPPGTSGVIGPPTPPTPRIITATAIVRGRVTTSSRTPVRSAEVRLRSDDGRDVRITTTDSAGQYEIRDLPSGSWMLMVSKAGFVSHATDILKAAKLENGERLSMNVTLAKAGAIAGRVMDDGGEPLAAVQVQAFKRRTASEDSFTAVGVADTTDDTGAFRLYAIPPGTYYLRAITDAGDRAPGFVNNEHPVYYPGTSDPGNAETVTIAAGQEQLGLTLSIPAPVEGVTVSGTIMTAAANKAGDDTALHLTRATTAGRSRDSGLIGQISNGQFRFVSVPWRRFLVKRSPIASRTRRRPTRAGVRHVTGGSSGRRRRRDDPSRAAAAARQIHAATMHG
jgi:hypothetical protein